MRNVFREFARSFKGGVERAFGKQDSDIQLGLLTERLADSSVSDDAIVREVFNFLRKFPEQMRMQNFHALLHGVMSQRPETIGIFEARLEQSFSPHVPRGDDSR